MILFFKKSFMSMLMLEVVLGKEGWDFFFYNSNILLSQTAHLKVSFHDNTLFKINFYIHYWCEQFKVPFF